MQEQINIDTTTAIEATIEDEPPSSLYEACADGNLDQVKTLLQDSDTNVNEMDGDDWTPLHHAIHGGNVDLVKFLVEEKRRKSRNHHHNRRRSRNSPSRRY